MKKLIKAISVFRFIAGAGIGVAGTCAQMYIIETAHPSIRGTLTGIADFLVGIGILIVLGLGVTGVGWRGAAGIIGILTCVPLFVGIYLCPDSPRWLVTKGRDERAADSLRKLRGSEYNIDEELTTIQEANAKLSGNKKTMFQQFMLLKLKKVYKPFLLVCGVYTLNQLSGNYIIYSYTVVIFQAAGVGLKPIVSAVLVGLARLTGSIIGLVVVEKAGRRVSLLVGGTSGAITFSALGAWFWLLDRNPDSAKSMGWLPLLSLLTFSIVFAASTSPIPFLLAGELLPLSFR